MGSLLEEGGLPKGTPSKVGHRSVGRSATARCDSICAMWCDGERHRSFESRRRSRVCPDPVAAVHPEAVRYGSPIRTASSPGQGLSTSPPRRMQRHQHRDAKGPRIATRGKASIVGRDARMSAPPAGDGHDDGAAPAYRRAASSGCMTPLRTTAVVPAEHSRVRHVTTAPNRAWLGWPPAAVGDMREGQRTRAHQSGGSIGRGRDHGWSTVDAQPAQRRAHACDEVIGVERSRLTWLNQSAGSPRGHARRAVA